MREGTDEMSDRIRTPEDIDRPADLSERVTRLEVWRQADRERMMAFETEVRTGLMDLRGRSDAIFTRLNDIVQAQRWGRQIRPSGLCLGRHPARLDAARRLDRYSGIGGW